MRTQLDDFADKGRALLSVGASVLHPKGSQDLTDPENGKELVFAALVAILHYCYSAEIDFDQELRSASELVGGDLDDDREMQTGGAV